jgi:hypothetical protein
MYRTCIAALLLAAAFAGHAAERTYAILSLVGDRLLLVGHRAAVETRRDSNLREYADLGSPALDNAALLAVEAAVKTAQPDAKTVLLAVGDREAYRAQEKALEGDGGIEGIVATLGPTLASAHATHLVLLTKERHETLIPLLHGHTGSGFLEGLGFYIDRNFRLVNSRTGEHYTGYLAPFAYFRISVVDIASSRVLKEDRVLASFTRGNTETLHPWDAMTAQQKAAALQGLLRREIARRVPALLPND